MRCRHVVSQVEIEVEGSRWSFCPPLAVMTADMWAALHYLLLPCLRGNCYAMKILSITYPASLHKPDHFRIKTMDAEMYLCSCFRIIFPQDRHCKRRCVRLKSTISAEKSVFIPFQCPHFLLGFGLSCLGEQISPKYCEDDMIPLPHVCSSHCLFNNLA